MNIKAEISLTGYLLRHIFIVLLLVVFTYGFGLLVVIPYYYFFLGSMELALSYTAVQIRLGTFSRRVSTVSLRKVESTALFQSFLGRIFGYGQIEFTGTGGTRDFSPLINNPQGFKAMIENLMEGKPIQLPPPKSENRTVAFMLGAIVIALIGFLILGHVIYGSKASQTPSTVATTKSTEIQATTRETKSTSDDQSKLVRLLFNKTTGKYRPYSDAFDSNSEMLVWESEQQAQGLLGTAFDSAPGNHLAVGIAETTPKQELTPIPVRLPDDDQSTAAFNMLQDQLRKPHVKSVKYDKATDSYTWTGPKNGKRRSMPRAQFESEIIDPYTKARN
jgi:hypothetical protein